MIEELWELALIMGAFGWSNNVEIEPPQTPEMYTYDNLGEYGKDWILLEEQILRSKFNAEL